MRVGGAWNETLVDLIDGMKDANGDWEVLTAEMKRYEYVISATGHISYNAPSGYHDD